MKAVVTEIPAESAEMSPSSDAAPAELDKPDKEPKRTREDRDRERPSRIMNQIVIDEERSLQDWAALIGTQGAFKIQLSRTKPASLTVNGKTWETAGFLDTYDHLIDEDFIKREWGGGTYALRVSTLREGGCYRYEKGLHRTIAVAGEPRMDRLPGNVSAPTPTAGQSGENPSIVKTVLETMRDQIDRAQQAQRPQGVDPTMQLFLDQMRADAERRDQQIRDLQARLDKALNQKPPEDPIKDQILGTLIKGESGRVDSIRANHESEIRQLRESHQQELRLLNERFDRERDHASRAHERALDTIKSSYEREIAAMRNLSEVNSTSVKGTFDIQVHTYKAEVARLERDNNELRLEVRELREKKDKSLIDQLKEIETLREALSSGDEDKAKGAWEKIAETVMNPAAIEQIGKIFQRPAAAGAPAPAQVAAQQPQQPVILRDRRTGQRFVQTPQGLAPVKKIPQKVATEDGRTVDLPEVDPSQMAVLVNYLERAFQSRHPPEVVAQSGRTAIPENIIGWIRDNDSRGTSGVDLFMSKVAKLPGTSPLQTQAGRNWLRKVSKALTGDEIPTDPAETETETEPVPPVPTQAPTT